MIVYRVEVLERDCNDWVVIKQTSLFSSEERAEQAVIDFCDRYKRDIDLGDIKIRRIRETVIES